MKICYNFFAIILIMISTGQSCSDKKKETPCEDIPRFTQIKLKYLDTEGNDLFFSSSPKYSLDDLSMYHIIDGEQYSIKYSVIEEEPRHIIVQGSPNDEATFFIRLTESETDEIHFKGSRDYNKPCPENKVDELYHNGNKMTVDNLTGVWTLIK